MNNQLIINPLISVRNYEKNQEILNIQTAAPKKGNFIKIHSFIKKNNNIFFDKLRKIVLDSSKKEINNLSEDEKEILKKSNILIGLNDKSEFPKYNCQISCPIKAKKRFGLILNTNYMIGSMTSIPPEVKKRCFNSMFYLAFDNSKTILWVKEYMTNAWWPYSLNTHLLNIVKKIIKGKININSLCVNDQSALYEIGFLQYNGHKQFRKLSLKKHIESYQTNNSINLKNLINEHVRLALKDFLNKLKTEGFMRFGDYQSGNRYWAHNETINRFVQAQLCDYISEVVNEKWIPAFSYYVSYENGSSLKKHLDRSQASLSLSLLIDYGNEHGELEDIWPLFIEEKKGSDTYRKYIIGKRNAGLFLGNEYVHYRLPISRDHYSMSMLFHFAPANFKGKIL